MGGKQMPLWMSIDKELRIADMGEDWVAINLFAEDMVVGLMLQREEIESMVYALAEYCGFPIFSKNGGLDGSFDDNISS